MWKCPKCQIDCDDSLSLCSKCGSGKGGILSPEQPAEKNTSSPISSNSGSNSDRKMSAHSKSESSGQLQQDILSQTSQSQSLLETENSGKNTMSTSNNTENSEIKLSWTGGNYSGKALRPFMILCWLITLVLVGLGIFWFQTWKSGWVWGITLTPVIILWFYFLTIYFYRTKTIHYELNSERLIFKHGLFKQVTDTTLIAQINDQKLIRTLWDKLLCGGVGTIILYTSDTTDPEFKMNALECPENAYESIDRLRQEFVRKRGFKSLGGDANSFDLN